MSVTHSPNKRQSGSQPNLSTMEDSNNQQLATRKRKQQQTKIKNELENIKEKQVEAKQKINNLERNIDEITNNKSKHSDSMLCEDILQELQERKQRSNNVFIIGLPEAKDKTRPVKVFLTSPAIVKDILRNKPKDKTNSIKIYSDQTPLQANYFKKLKEELKRRKNEGETAMYKIC
ncbi:unnamed protein product [Leptosia nina]|uniref:Uncharacterized protein n=1 Tax=Leptosia nina TaxID=320188 RepID=A0AAV1JZG7_9NEOP